MKRAIIRQKIVITATPQEVYKALIDPKVHSKFTGSKASGSQKEGGKFTAYDGYIQGKHILLKKGESIVQEWTTTEWPKDLEPSTLRIDLEKIRKGTRLEMTHTKVPASQAAGYKQGWKEFYWKPLQEYFKRPKTKR
jgi:activator of HSP90 ATPase